MTGKLTTTRAERDKRDDLICQLRKEGHGPASIARQLGVTRSVVCGVLFRAGLTNLHARREKAPPKKQTRAVVGKGKPAKPKKPILVDVRSLEFEPIPTGLDAGCRWLRGEPADRLFCGHETYRGTSWCLHHFQRVYTVLS